MPEQSSNFSPTNPFSADKSVDELLLLIADDDQGLKPAAMEELLSMEFATLYPLLERSVRNDDNADLRNSAMEVLVRFGKKSLFRLTRLLQDDNEEVRNFAAVMLGDIGNREAVGALIQALRDKDPNVSHAAAEALGKIGDRAALMPLIELLKGDFWLQYAAVTAIGAMQDQRAVPHLLNILDNELLAGPVIQTLGEIGDPRAIYPLCNILVSDNEALTGSVAKALVEIYRCSNESLKYKNSLMEFSQPGQLQTLINNRGITKLQALLSPTTDRPTVEAAVTILGWIGDIGSLNHFFQLLELPEYLPAVESAILSLGQTAIDNLLAALEHPNDNVKIVAVRSLRWLGEPGPDAVLGSLLQSSNTVVVVEALESLKNFPTASLVPELCLLLQYDNHEIYFRAAEALGNFPLSKLQPFLHTLIDNDQANLRRRAALLLSQMQSGGSIDLLERLAADQEIEVRCEALKAVGVQRVTAALPLLQHALTDPDLTVRETAIMALAEFGAPNFIDELLAILDEGEARLGYAVIKAIGAVRAFGAGPTLMEYLQRHDIPKNLEYAIVETFGRINFTAASGLISARYLQHADPDMRRLAVETLGKLGDQNSLRGVESAAKDPHWSVRVAALHVLGRVGGAGELPLLLAAMEDSDYLVRKNAILALGNVHDISTVPALAHQLTDMEMSKYAFEALLKYGKMALPWLHRLITKNFPLELRVRVIDLIGKISDRKSVEPLLGLLDETNPEIRLAAIDSLTFCYDSLPLKRLANIKKNDGSEEVRERAELALKTFMMEKYF